MASEGIANLRIHSVAAILHKPARIPVISAAAHAIFFDAGEAVTAL